MIAIGTPATDGEYRLNLMTIEDFDSLSTTESEDITLTSADGTNFNITLTFAEDTFDLGLSASTLTYVDTAVTDDFVLQTGTATATDGQGTIRYGIVDDSDNVVLTLERNSGVLSINESTGAYTFTPNDEFINGLLSMDANESFYNFSY